MSLEFLTPAGPVPARSPIHVLTERDGATFEERDGWLVAASFPGEDAGAPVRWSDLSHIRKTQVGAGEGLAMSPTAGLVLGDPVAGLDITTQLAAIRISGPSAREAIARFCALDLRPAIAPPGSFRPGSVARNPGYVLVQDDGFLLLFGSAFGEYVWEVVADAGRHLGGGPAGA